MRFFLLVLVAARVCAQPASGTSFIDMGGDVIRSYQFSNGGESTLDYTTQYSWSITRASNGDKVFTFSAKECTYNTAIQPFPGAYFWTALPMPSCAPLSQSAALTLGPISAALTEFYNYHPSAPHLPPVYQSVKRSQLSLRPELTTEQPAIAPDPMVMFLDGLGNSAIQFDLATETIAKQITVPSTAGPMGIRPALTGPQTEIWLASSGGVTVADFSAGKVVATIPTPSVPVAVSPAGIVFTNDGATALEAVTFSSPDSAGNQGALLVFNVVGRTLTSTLLLKDRPTALVMAPDSSTAYLLDDAGNIAYYDILSGTADLTLSTFAPGKAGGYSGLAVFIHPDGTRLFWNNGAQISVFDLTAHKVTDVINSGLPPTSAASMQMAQDGATIWMANALGMVAVYDTRSSMFLGTFTTDPGSVVYPGVVN
jgi:DNA-binding beta-propeller fold protein YncE